MTLPRTLEPEVMDTREEAIAYDEMDHHEVNEQFVGDLLEFAELSGDVLDLGCGTAQLPVILCEHVSEIRVMAVDLAVSMLDLAKYNVEASGLIDRIQLMLADAKQTEFEDAIFDVVISNSIIHHVPDPKAVIAETIRLVKPGGVIFFRDLMRPETAEAVDALVRNYAGEESGHAQQLFRDSLHAALTVPEMQSEVASFGYPAASVIATSDRHWTWSARRPR